MCAYHEPIMVYNLGMGGHGYGGAGDASSGFHGGHFVHMRGLPFRATENDIANVSKWYIVGIFIILGGEVFTVASEILSRLKKASVKNRVNHLPLVVGSENNPKLEDALN